MTNRYYISSWEDVLYALRGKPWRSAIRLRKGVLPHPLEVGMTTSTGLPVGQNADYRFVLQDGAGLHVQDFGQHYEAHLDEAHPDVNLYDHFRKDAPTTFVASGAALGAAVGGAVGRDASSALVGGLIGGLLAGIAASLE